MSTLWKKNRPEHQHLNLRSMTPQGRNSAIWLLCAYIYKQMPERLYLTASLAQERQEHFQKIVLEGTERMEDQVRSIWLMHMAHQVRTVLTASGDCRIWCCFFFLVSRKIIWSGCWPAMHRRQFLKIGWWKLWINWRKNLLNYFMGKLEIYEEYYLSEKEPGVCKGSSFPRFVLASRQGWFITKSLPLRLQVHTESITVECNWRTNG